MTIPTAVTGMSEPTESRSNWLNELAGEPRTIRETLSEPGAVSRVLELMVTVLKPGLVMSTSCPGPGKMPSDQYGFCQLPLSALVQLFVVWAMAADPAHTQRQSPTNRMEIIAAKSMYGFRAN